MSLNFDDISDVEDNNDFSQDLSLDDSDFDGIMNDTTRESISDVDLSLDDNTLGLSELDNNIEIDSTNDTTKESELSFEGGKRRTRRRKNIKRKKTHKKENRKTHKIHRKTRKVNKKKLNKNLKYRKTRRMRSKMSGGNVDSLGDADFNPNIAFDKKAMGGAKVMGRTKQQGGRPVGFNCYDPNFSIYNTRSLQLFPYKP